MSPAPRVHEDIQEPSTPLASATEANDANGVRARFVDESGTRRVSLLEIEPVRAPLERAKLLDALFQLRVQVVGSPAGHLNGSVLRLRVVEFDGGEIGRSRERELCRELPVMLAQPDD